MMRGPRRTTTGYDLTQQAQQVKAITRLGMMLRTDFDLEHVFTQLVDAINSLLGFKCAALNLVRSESAHVEVVALAGLSSADGQALMNNPPSLQGLLAGMTEHFLLGRRSYFISHEHKHVLDAIPGVTTRRPGPPPTTPGAWHPDDMFLVPLISPRDGRMLAVLSLDEPANGKIPSAEIVEMVELFADQGALAIETCLLFQEREYREASLRQGIAALIATLGEVRQGNLSARAVAQDPALTPLAESLNSVVGALEGILGELREAGTTVANNAGSVRAIATHLASQSSQRTDRMLGVSQEVQIMAESVRQIAETARDASIAAIHAIDRSNNGRISAENAAEGMEQVREVTLQSAKKVQRLREGIQEIGALAQTVTEYAQQTNLHTINATLQAMRAGEDGGRGFAVIAREIRDLAANTAAAAKQINGVLQQVQTEAQQMESFIAQNAQQVEHQSQLASEAGAAMDEVDSATQQITQAIKRISETATTQANAAETIAQATVEIAERTREDRQSVERMHSAMDHMAGLADGLLRQVAFFHGASGSPASGPGDAASRPGGTWLGTSAVLSGQSGTTTLPRMSGPHPLATMPPGPDGMSYQPTAPTPSVLSGNQTGPVGGAMGATGGLPAVLPPWLRQDGLRADAEAPREATPPTGLRLDRNTMTRGPAVPRLVPLGEPAMPAMPAMPGSQDQFPTMPASTPPTGTPLGPTASTQPDTSGAHAWPPLATAEIETQPPALPQAGPDTAASSADPDSDPDTAELPALRAEEPAEPDA